jgi:hypothetical protein
MRIRAGLALGLLLVLGAAGCGSADGGDGVATAGGRASATSSARAGQPVDDKENWLRFSRCMRENGVPNFPDPEINDGGGVSLSLPAGVDKEKIDAAQATCKQYLPNGGEPQKADPQVVAQQRKFSQCMRENGVPKFPDPTDAGLQVNGDALGMGPDDPTLKAAETACSRHMPKPPSGEGSPSMQRRNEP